MPNRVKKSVLLLCAALLLRVIEIYYNGFVSEPLQGATRITSIYYIDIIALIFNAFLIYLISKGNRIARIIFIIFFLLLNIPVVVPTIAHLAEGNLFISGTLLIIFFVLPVFTFILKAIAMYLLFTGVSRELIKNQ